MNIAIIGYGRMGCLIEKIAKDRNHNITSIIDPINEKATHKEISEQSLQNADVVIDFTHPDCAIDNINKVTALNKNLVMGTTGWYDQLEQVKNTIDHSDIGFIWSGNFSIGVNIFFNIIQNAAKIINNVEAYDISTHEFHHNQKADSPSGTASMIGDILIKNIDRKKTIVTEELKRKIEPEELHISSTRCGSFPGTHSVIFDSLADTIELKHTARTREGFALGAVLAAEFIKDKKGFFQIDDLMKNIIKEE